MQTAKWSSILVLFLMAAVLTGSIWPRRPGGGIDAELWSEDFNATSDDFTSTEGTTDDDCTTGGCPLEGAESVKVGGGAETPNKWIKDNAFTDRSTGCVTYHLQVDNRGADWTTNLRLRKGGGDTAYWLKISSNFGSPNDIRLNCGDTSIQDGELTDDTDHTIVIDINMVNGNLDLYLDGATSPTVACDGSDDTEAYDGVNLQANNTIAIMIYDQVQFCPGRTVSGVCSCE